MVNNPAHSFRLKSSGRPRAYVNAGPFLDPRPLILRPLPARSVLRAPKSSPSLNFHRAHAALPSAAGVSNHTRHTPTSEPPCTRPFASPKHSGFHLKKSPETASNLPLERYLTPIRHAPVELRPGHFISKGARRFSFSCAPLRQTRSLSLRVPLALFNHLGDFGRTFQKGTSSSIEAPFRA